MDWMECFKAAIGYMEAHLFENIGTEDVAAAVHLSPFYFQAGFKLVTGYSVKEYLRGRRLYLAALSLLAGEEKVIDLSYRCGYETPESFSKAFARFHGVSPSQVRGNAALIRPFLPLQIKLTVQGGQEMDYITEQMDALPVIGFSRRFSLDTAYTEIPKFWNEYLASCRTQPEEIRSVLERCHVGQLGVCIDDEAQPGTFRYLIAGFYDGGTTQGLEVETLPASQWAKFRCVGPLPGALQAVNTELFRQWLPGNPRYEMAGAYNLEWYGPGDADKADYESAIWIPVREK